MRDHSASGGPNFVTLIHRGAKVRRSRAPRGREVCPNPHGTIAMRPRHALGPARAVEGAVTDRRLHRVLEAALLGIVATSVAIPWSREVEVETLRLLLGINGNTVVRA